MLVSLMSLCALGIGVLLPLRWGLWGFLLAAFGLFAVQVGVNAATGFIGASWEESLLLFNGSLVSYFGFNLQITYRAFALVLLALAAPFIWRLARA